jgi:hypothetical protein
MIEKFYMVTRSTTSMQMSAHDRAKGWSVSFNPHAKHGALSFGRHGSQRKATDTARPP